MGLQSWDEQENWVELDCDEHWPGYVEETGDFASLALSNA